MEFPAADSKCIEMHGNAPSKAAASKAARLERKIQTEIRTQQSTTTNMTWIRCMEFPATYSKCIEMQGNAPSKAAASKAAILEA